MSDGNNNVVGDAVIKRGSEIKTWDDIDSVKVALAEEMNYKRNKIIIVNFIKL
jgi:hypothetical protein